MKRVMINLVLLWSMAFSVHANSKPVVTLVSAGMRPGTSLMDVVYRVDDSDDATVKVRALAFIDGVHSFDKVLRPTSWAEGTETNLGDAIATGVEHTLTWAVGADWDIDLGKVKFEVLCRDGRELLPIEWITIPAADGNPELTISKDSPADADVLDAFFWQYSDFDSGIYLTNGIVYGAIETSEFSDVPLVSGRTIHTYGLPYICREMDIDPAVSSELLYANDATRGLYDLNRWYIIQRIYDGVEIPIVRGWGENNYWQSTAPSDLFTSTAIAAGTYFSLALKSDGTVVEWGHNLYGQDEPPSNLTNAIAVSAYNYQSFALRSDGTIIGWGKNSTVPADFTNMIAIAAGDDHSLALKNDGTVVGWGANNNGELDIPFGLSNVTAIAAGNSYSLVLKDDGSIVGWGWNEYGQASPPSLTDAVAIAASYDHSLALKSEGTVVGWGRNSHGQINIPSGLTNVIAIAAGSQCSLALKGDGTVVAWGRNDYGQTTVPDGLTNVTAIAGGSLHNLAIQIKP